MLYDEARQLVQDAMDSIYEVNSSISGHLLDDKNLDVPFNQFKSKDKSEFLHFDSLDFLEMIMYIEEQIGQEIPDPLHEELNTPKELIEFLIKHC